LLVEQRRVVFRLEVFAADDVLRIIWIRRGLRRLALFLVVLICGCGCGGILRLQLSLRGGAFLVDRLLPRDVLTIDLRLRRGLLLRGARVRLGDLALLGHALLLRSRVFIGATTLIGEALLLDTLLLGDALALRPRLCVGLHLLRLALRGNLLLLALLLLLLRRLAPAAAAADHQARDQQQGAHPDSSAHITSPRSQ
jgi:hypothetical protein